MAIKCPSLRLLIGGVAVLLVGLTVACGSNKQGSSSNSSNAAPIATQAATVASAPSPAAAVPSPSGATSASAQVSACAPSALTTSITGAGSTFDAPLFSKLFDLYNQQCKEEVNYQSVGSGAGIEQLTKKTVNFGATDAPLTDDQIKAAGGDVLHIPVTIGAVPIGYNVPGVQSGVKLSGDVVAKIFLGTITKWNDPAIAALNSGVKLPALDIAVVHRSDGSGTSFIFTNYLAAVSSDWKSKVGAGTSVDWPTGAGGKGSEGVAALVKQTPGGIGYFELAYAAQNNITVATLQNQAGKFVDPTVAGASAAAAAGATNIPPDLRALFVNAPGDASYPIAGFSWIAINQNQSDSKVAASLVHMIWWAVHDGQQYSNALSYAPLAQPVVKLDEAQLLKVTVGGKPVLAQ